MPAAYVYVGVDHDAAKHRNERICAGCGATLEPRQPGQGMLDGLHSVTECLIRLREEKDALRARVDRLEQYVFGQVWG